MHDDISQERVEMPEPGAISLAGIRYEAMPWGKARGLGQNGGFVVAIDEATNEELWLLKVYDVPYDQEMEEDVQDVFISALELESGNLLHVTDEHDNHYLVNMETRTATKWEGRERDAADAFRGLTDHIDINSSGAA
jgi:hypothetical protein